MGFWDRGIPDKYKKYVTNNTLRAAFHKALKSGDMSGWEASINYQPPPTPEPAGTDADTEAVPPGEAVGGKEKTEPFNMEENPTPETLGPAVVEDVGDIKDGDTSTPTDGDTSTPTSLLKAAETNEGVVEPEKDIEKMVGELKENGHASGKRVEQLQEYSEAMTGISPRTPGTINAAGSATIAALSGLGKNIDEVQSGFSKFRENIKGGVASGVSALKGEVGWGSHSSEYDQFKSDLEEGGLDEDTVRQGRAIVEGQAAKDAGGVEVGQEDKKKLESDVAHQKYKSDMIAQGGAIGADAFKGAGGKAVSFNRMGQY